MYQGQHNRNFNAKLNNIIQPTKKELLTDGYKLFTFLTVDFFLLMINRQNARAVQKEKRA